jgi:glycosyltransferase involved in cell wall biosynthesis
MQNYSVIIPTRNRHDLLNSLISKIDFEDTNLMDVIVIDSSDVPIQQPIQVNKLKYIHTDIKSAATQRNIGIDNLMEINQNVFFVDDDVVLPENYFQQLNLCLLEDEVIGASGLAINSKKKLNRSAPRGALGFYKRIFLLDSMQDGALLSSAINIPIREENVTSNRKINSDWIIGCSAWKSKILNEIRFEDKFKGQSLGEDVLFSGKAKTKGRLVVDPSLILDHLESEIERPNLRDFYVMWISNRYEISNQLHLSWFNFAFHWANLGKFLMIIGRSDLTLESKKSMIIGIMHGYRAIMNRHI